MTRIKTWLAYAISVVLALAVGGFLFAWSGLYNVAASRGHWAAVEWMLSFVMSNSVERRALFVDVPHLDDRDLVALGAEHYRTGCAPCHGGGGRTASPVARHMLPPPPDLTGVTRRWTDRELFWIVMHGIKYTGMPAWISQTREDEVWAIVAYLKILDAGSPESAFATSRVDKRDAAGIVQLAASRCSICHGDDHAQPVSALVPALQGQSAEYIAASLRAYATGERNSGIMQPAAAELSSVDIDGLADYYATLTAPATATTETRGSASVDLGRILATEGMPQHGIPACNSCHGTEALKTYPRLSGLSARYISAQLRLWQENRRSPLGASAIMAPIAQRLNAEQVEAAAAFYAGSARLQAAQ